jgi:hypothetical protein
MQVYALKVVVNKFLFVFLLVSSIELSCACPVLPLDTTKLEVVSAEHNNESPKNRPFYSCSHEKKSSLCVPMLRQIGELVISLCFIGFAILASKSPRTIDFQVVEQSQSSIRLMTQVLVAAGACIIPCRTRYLSIIHEGPTCFGTAFFSPIFFVEVPYFFYQRNYAQKDQKQKS